MSDKPRLDKKSNQPHCYEIRLQGHLNGQWTDWFEGLTITMEVDGTTLLTGPVVDQASLHGLLRKIRDLGMPLVSICPVQPSNFGSSSYKKEKK